jgi:hypothetical protein
MASSKNILKAKKICAYLRPANKWFLDLIYAEAEKAGFLPLPDQSVRLLWLTVQRMVEGPQPPHLQDQPGVSIGPTDDLHLLACRIYQGSYHDAVAAYFRHRPDFPRIPAGRPRQDALAREAAQFKTAGFSHEKIARRLNQAHGEGTATRESVRKLIKRIESPQPASPRTKPKN